MRSLNFPCTAFIPQHLQFTIDNRPDLWYGCACYLEQISLTPPAIPALTLAFSYSCKLFCALKKSNPFIIKQIQTLSTKPPGVRVPPRDGCRTEAQKCLSVSPFLATLTHSVSRKSFPCHSYANTRDRGATLAPNLSSNLLSDFSRHSFTKSVLCEGPHATRHSLLTLTPFRINTCKGNNILDKSEGLGYSGLR